ncbi:hypothetical protein DOY81_015579, partial [Sarcophaga bullata]
RRKSPNVTAKTTPTNIKTSTNPTGGGGGGVGGGVTPVLAEITLRRTPPMMGNGHSLMNNVNTTTASTNCSAAITTTATNTSSSVTPLYSEKKLKKPSSNYEPAAALQRPTIASTVKMCQAAIEKTKAQTQGDKLNQIKAMRRQHNSRSGGSTGETESPFCGMHEHVQQPFRNNNNLVNVLNTIPTIVYSVVVWIICSSYGSTVNNSY